MKRKLALILILILIAVTLTACAMPTAPDPDSVDEEGNVVVDNDSPTGTQATTGENTADMKPSSVSAFKDDGSYSKALNEYDRYDVDINGDGKDDSVILYTGADQAATGEWVFDDGQEWTLVATVDDASYALFERKYVQNGKVSYDMYRGETDGLIHIVVTCTQGSAMDINDYSYTLENGFTKVPVYVSGAINPVHSV